MCAPSDDARLRFRRLLSLIRRPGFAVVIASVIWCLAFAPANGNFLYWSGGGAIHRAFKTGGPIATIFEIADYPGAPSLVIPQGVAVDAKSVFWADFATDQILRGDKDGKGTVEVLYSALDYLEPPTASIMSAIALDTQYLYWIDTTAIYRGLKDGSQVDQLFGMEAQAHGGIAVDADYVYWLNAHEGRILRGPKGGGSPEVLYGIGEYTPVSLYDLTVDDHALYWTDIRTGELLSAPKDGTGPVAAIYSTFSIRHVAIDEHLVYWTVEHTSTADYILGAAKEGQGVPLTLFVSPPGPGYLAVDPVPEPSSLVIASLVAAMLLPFRICSAPLASQLLSLQA